MSKAENVNSNPIIQKDAVKSNQYPAAPKGTSVRKGNIRKKRSRSCVSTCANFRR